MLLAIAPSNGRNRKCAKDSLDVIFCTIQVFIADFLRMAQTHTHTHTLCMYTCICI